jgi:hypothetical protein
MKRLQPFFLIILLAIGFSSCSKSPACKGQDENNGIIEKYYGNHNFPMCMETYVNEQGTLVIRSNEELSTIIDSNCANLPEAGYSEDPPEIDFSKYSLLGFWATGGGCEIKIVREVTSSDEDGKYYYKIKIIECGLCDMLRYDANLVLVPKLPEDFKVDFLLNN